MSKLIVLGKNNCTFASVFSHTIFGGDKSQWLIAFYGYGQEANVYEPLYEIIKETHNLLVIDNPMQTMSHDIYAKDFEEYIEKICAENGIEKLTSISYSMGSRLNLYMPVFFANQLEKIILIAPDGIIYNFWNRVAISTPWGRRLFLFFVNNGKAYHGTLTFFNKIGIVNKALYAFSKWNMRDQQRRTNVYNAWINLRHFRPKLKVVNAQCEQHNISITTYFGTDDAVIPQAVFEKCKKAFPTGAHQLIESDHRMLRVDLFKKIATELNA